MQVSLTFVLDKASPQAWLRVRKETTATRGELYLRRPIMEAFSGFNRGQYEGTLQGGAPKFFLIFRSKKLRRIYIFGPRDHCGNVDQPCTSAYANSELWRWPGRSFPTRFSKSFNKFSTLFLHKLGVPSVDLGPETISEALVVTFRTEDLQRPAS